jgi:AraC family transcriptional regulator of adaptative response/methylated-DNA-[protein]-cysteine methyltransferase
MMHMQSATLAASGLAASGSAADDERYEALRRRDPRADGTFYYAVATTGVYCRPSCAARLANRRNVRLFASPAAAEAAGFRACKRCRPLGQDDRERMDATIARVCAHIDDASPEVPTLAALAEIAGLSPYHFHRAFTRKLGLSPRRYAAARRAERLGRRVREAPRVTDAAYDSGFGSSSRFYEEAGRALGMTPTAFRTGGAGERIRVAAAESSLGALVVAATERGVCAVRFGDDPAAIGVALRAEFPGAAFTDSDPDLDAWIQALVARVEGDLASPHVPLDLRGTAFQRRVWDALATIPGGERVSYAELARRIGMPGGARAVARAVGANPVAVVVPCHRVVGSDGGMRGYRWGVERKRALLARERQ